MNLSHRSFVRLDEQTHIFIAFRTEDWHWLFVFAILLTLVAI